MTGHLMTIAPYLLLVAATLPPGSQQHAQQHVQQRAQQQAQQHVQQLAALDRISAANMKGNLSFLASDALEGRDTPSKGLDIAAEFIASRFRKAGLEPVSGDSYFQKAAYTLVTTDTSDLELTLDDGTNTIHLTQGFDVQNLSAVDLHLIPVTKVTADPVGDLTGLVGDLIGKAALLEMPGHEKMADFTKLLKATREAHPAVVLLLPHGSAYHAPAKVRLVAGTPKAGTPPTVTVHDAAMAKLLSKNAAVTVSLHAKAPEQKPVELRNVAGVLRGSDPALRDTYVLVTAHYDHIGVLPSGDGDRINNGANDDGSGTVSVMELAESLAQLPHHPRRSILFLCFFGEEKGLFGSRYYAEHPLFPLKQTVAQINLEQLGRTDDTEGKQVSSATFTGFDFSDLPKTFKAAGKATGVRVYNNEKDGDAYFARSDNQSLADAGIPAHTLAVAFEFPDYHKPGDEWQKIDYENMAKVDRMIALGLLAVADSVKAPQWNAENPKTEPYRKAAAH